MRNKLIWFYQDAQETGEAGNSDHHKKKLFLSDGWDFPFVGVCIYMFRINISKQLPEEGFQKDLYDPCLLKFRFCDRNIILIAFVDFVVY